MKNFRVIVMAICGVFMLTGAGLAQDASKTEAKAKPAAKRSSQSKEIVGELVWKGQNKIAVLYQSDPATGQEEEVLLPYDSKLIIEHKRSMDEFERGDVVRVTYAQDSLDYGDRVDQKLKAVKISYVKKSGKAVYSAQPPVAQEAASSEAEDTASAEPLTLKGAK